MKLVLQLAAVGVALSLSACADSSSTTATKTAHTDAHLGSHVPHTYNAAGSEDEVNPAVAGERAFPTSTGSSAPSGTQR